MREMIVTSGQILRGLSKFTENVSGSTAIEYALIAAGLSIAIVASVNGVGSEVVGLFTIVAGLF